MRITVDRGAEAVHLALGEAAEARRDEVAAGVAVAYDAGGRIVGVEVRGVDPAALQQFTVELAGLAERPPAGAPAPRPVTSSAPAAVPSPAPYAGPVSWEPEAEAAVGQIPFFRRGPVRLAAIALARQRGGERVTLDILHEISR